MARPRRVSNRQRGILRKDTVARKFLTRDLLRAFDDELSMIAGDDDEPLPNRPKTRGECPAERPCVFTSCKYNLYLDVQPRTGSITFNRPDLEPGDMPPLGSCALDVAESGGRTLDAVGDMLNLTRERIRQLEVRALLDLLPRIRAANIELSDLPTELIHPLTEAAEREIDRSPLDFLG